jgi:type I restriction enzyme S subunit
VQIDIGRTPPRGEKKYWTTDLTRPFCTIADINGRVINPAREGVTELAETEGKAKRFPAGCLMMSFKLSIGRTGIAGRDLFPNEAIAWLRPYDENEVSLAYLRIYLPIHDYSAAVGRAVKGNTLNKKTLATLNIPVPPPDEQARLTHLITTVEDHVEALRTQVINAGKLSNSLLRDVISGAQDMPSSYDALLGDDW